MVRTRSDSLAKGKAKLYRPLTQASPRLSALWSNDAVQIPTQTPDVPVKEAITSTLPPKKRQSFRMAGESSSRRDTKTTCRRSRRLTALYNVTKPLSEEKVKNQCTTLLDLLINPRFSRGIGVYSSIFDLIGHEDMPRFKCGEANFGAEVAGKSERNEKIASKPRRPLLDQMRTQQRSHAYASRRGRQAQKADPTQMRTHRKLACVRISRFQHL
ncbi:hypothetical protein PIB30_047440 [Stylosanthes scabra]|uniref:Uncharacterized protein n=1 Tax=Stylosanthes scabra TaxID=79078 RepID=A0ABU6VF17_9FABA|nr:hypothetical protein [Stylosanthes scabra]